MWNWRMLLVTGEVRFADLIERTLYNGMLAGLSLDGTQYFYENPLADDGTHRRQEWFECACCPPNVARLLSSLPGYFVSVSDSTVWFHLYAAGTGAATLPGGETVEWKMTTNYPWDGDIEIELTHVPPTPVGLHLRVPGWVEDPLLAINGVPAETAPRPGSYAHAEHTWRPGDTLRLTLPMPVRRLVGHPNIVDTYGRIALMRGPLVYCIEQADHPNADLTALRLPADADLQAFRRPDLLGGIMTIEGDAWAVDLSDWQHALYRPAATVRDAPKRRVGLTAIPYYAWANRTPGPMTVWIPTF
jgi:DUF1680 family protein